MKKMNFSKLLMLLALPVTLTFAACSEDKEPSDIPAITVDGEQYHTVAFGVNADRKTVTVNSNYDWVAEAEDESYNWVTITPVTGSAGTTSVTIDVLENEDVGSRTAVFNLSVPFSKTSITVATITVTQSDTDDPTPTGDAIYYETVGTDVSKVDGYWPYVDAYTGWVRQGSVDQSAVTYTGSSATVRNSGATWDPSNTSIAAAPYAYIGNGGNFVIGNVATGGATNFTYKFAMQHTTASEEVDGSYVPVTADITSSTFGMYVGFDGTTYAEVDYSVSSASDNGWQIITVEFKVPSGTSSLYFKYADFSAGSGQSLRVDEMTLTEGGNGTLINPGGGGGGETGEAIYYETVGTSVSKDGSYWPYVDAYEGWVRQGSVNQSGVTYTGSSATVRNSGTSWDPSDTSIAAAPYAYIGNGGNFIIGNVATGGATNFTYKFAMQHTTGSNQVDGTYVPDTATITSSTFGMYVGFDGTTYADVDFTVGSASDNGWQIVTVEFKVPSGTSNLYFKYADFSAGSGQSLRVDEMTLTEGGNGTLINPGGSGGGDETVKTISEIRAMYSGSDVTISDNYVMKGSVVVDYPVNNMASLKNLMISDGTSGITVRLTTDPSTTEFPLGKEVQVSLQGATLTAYQGLVQINTSNSNVTLTGETKAITPIAVSATEFLTGNYQSMPVEIQNVQFISAHAGLAVNSSTLAPSGHSYSTLEDAGGNNVTVYVSSYASFFSTYTLPTYSGTIKGVGTCAGSTTVSQMLLPQGTTDFSGMTSPRFGSSDIFSVTANSTSAAAAANSTATLSVTSNVAWTASLDDTSFASISPASGSNNGTVTVTFDENTGSATRSVNVTVSTTASVSQNSYTFTITQAAAGGGGTVTEFFNESFGTPGSNTAVASYTGYDMTSPVVYSDSSGRATIRKTTTIDGHIWFPTTGDSDLSITGFESGHTNMTLSFDMAVNKSGASADVLELYLDGVQVTFNTDNYTFSAQNIYETFSVSVPDGTSEIKFNSDASKNTTATSNGIRVDNIIITGN